MARGVQWCMSTRRGLILVDAFGGQQEVHDVEMTILARDVQWRGSILICLILVDPFGGQQEAHDVQMAMLARDEQWRMSMSTRRGLIPVSYTHLTLPTKRIV